MRWHAALVCVLVVFLVLSIPGGGPLTDGLATAQQMDDGSSEGSQHTVRLVETVADGQMVMDIKLHANGDARWNVTMWFQLRSESDRRAFERLADDFDRGGGDATISIEPFQLIADRSAERTQRSMEIGNVSRTSHVTNETGLLSLSFTWSNFARSEDQTVTVGDVFVTDQGTWLPTLEHHQHLIIRAPDGYAVQSASTEVDNLTIHIEGPIDLEAGDIEATYVSSVGGSEPPATIFSPFTLGAIVLVALLVVAGLVRLAPRREWPLIGGRSDVERGGIVDESSPVQQPAAGGMLSQQPGQQVDDRDFSGADGGLWSDEERVVRLLEANRGRMKQANIVTETDWSNAKVSQLLSGMADEGTIEKLRIGRENLITLVEYDEEIEVGES